MSNIYIIEEKCVGCGLCAKQCPFGAITISNKKARITSKCTLCTSCLDSCKFGAIVLEKEDKSINDISQYSGIWVYAEQRKGQVREVVFELLAQAKVLAQDLAVPVTAVFLGETIGDNGEKLLAYGADEVKYIEADWLKEQDDQVYGEVMINLIENYKPEIVLIGATSFGRSLAPNISASLHTGLTADCTVLEIDKEERLLLQTRPAFGGNLMATIICPHTRPQMATVRPRVFKPLKPDFTKKGKLQKLTAPAPIKTLVKKLRSIEHTSDGNITGADIIVGVGKGIGSKKNVALAEQLAKALGGVVAATRPVVDAGWLPYSRQIGQTGKVVSPKLYIACGISGAIQHVAGMADIDTVIAINNDADAPIFNYAHYKIVANCLDVLPALTAAIQQDTHQDNLEK